MASKKDQTNDEKDLITVDDAAAILGVSRATVYSMSKRGLLSMRKRKFRLGPEGALSFLSRSEVEYLKAHPFEEEAKK